MQSSLIIETNKAVVYDNGSLLRHVQPIFYMRQHKGMTFIKGTRPSLSKWADTSIVNATKACSIYDLITQRWERLCC